MTDLTEILIAILGLLVLGIIIFGSGSLGYRLGHFKGQSEQVKGGIWIELDIDDNKYEGFVTKVGGKSK